ncbi:response regulator transcription factor [uncultured Slackia sp.]|uniref:response regulator transcription factor n=1 Tax=uncultured Slackia sp. TaxID=665903 RepID=UPI0026DEDA6B|nr:response regulator transcription factor [uncultured Slackia sp.]
MARILAIDDEPAVLSLLVAILKKDGHEVVAIESADKALGLDFARFNLILCDVMMPGTDGFEFVTSVRERVDCPIVFLTAKSEENDAVTGLSVGADDYVRKPFGAAELRAKVAAHLRREKRERHAALAFDGIRIDLAAKQLYVHDAPIKLTKWEYAICEHLAKHPGQVFSKAQILEVVAGWDAQSDVSTVAVHVGNARAKLKSAGVAPIETIWGIGYKWVG